MWHDLIDGNLSSHKKIDVTIMFAIMEPLTMMVLLKIMMWAAFLLIILFMMIR